MPDCVLTPSAPWQPVHAAVFAFVASIGRRLRTQPRALRLQPGEVIRPAPSCRHRSTPWLPRAIIALSRAPAFVGLEAPRADRPRAVRRDSATAGLPLTPSLPWQPAQAAALPRRAVCGGVHRRAPRPRIIFGECGLWHAVHCCVPAWVATTICFCSAGLPGIFSWQIGQSLRLSVGTGQLAARWGDPTPVDDVLEHACDVPRRLRLHGRPRIERPCRGSTLWWTPLDHSANARAWHDCAVIGAFELGLVRCDLRDGIAAIVAVEIERVGW